MPQEKIPSACCGQLDCLYSNDNKRNKSEIFRTWIGFDITMNQWFQRTEKLIDMINTSYFGKAI